MLEIAVDGRTWCGMCPLSVAAGAYALAKGRASSENVFTPFVFLSFSPFLATHLSSCAQFSSSLSFHQVVNQSIMILIST